MLALRRFRGIVGTALVWGIGWAAISWPIYFLIFPNLSALARVTAASWLSSRVGVAGAATGATFALLVLAFERRHGLCQFTTQRAALWGVLAGCGSCFAALAVTPTGFSQAPGLLGSALALGTTFGGATAAFTLLAARRSARLAAPTGPSMIASRAT